MKAENVLTKEEIMAVVEAWYGTDCAPGHLTWEELQSCHGVGVEEARQLCPIFTPEDFVEAKDRDDVVNLCYDLWYKAIIDEKKKTLLDDVEELLGRKLRPDESAVIMKHYSDRSARENAEMIEDLEEESDLEELASNFY